MYRRLLCTLLLLGMVIACATTALAGEGPANSARAALSGNDAIIYDFLEKHIVRVASGAESQTVFQLPISELGMTGSWSAADLGVEALVVDGKMTKEASDALRQKLAHNNTLILQALIYDHPYQMFWYDKTQGTLVFPEWKPFLISSNGTQYISFYEDSYLTFVLSVAQEYASGATYDDTGLLYAVSSAALTDFKVQAAAANAAQIVAANADKSDYQKLVAYKEAICNAVAYNHTAAADNTTPYGNPWQLIYVFDEDPSTDVVCEGYAKAFKYLCDLSTFEADISCYLVSGFMSTGSTPGPHMWNIVSMGNGQSYLVDVTNCDEHTVGAPSWLFLAGDDLPPEYDADYGVSIPEQDLGNGYIALAAKVLYRHDPQTQALWGATGILEIADSDYAPPPPPPCSHSFTTKPSGTLVSPATCTSPAYYKVQCDLCDAISDTVKVAVGAATGHTSGAAVEENRVAPTCSAPGSYDSVVYCSTCSAQLSRTPTEIPATGNHTDTDSNSKCDSCGTVLSHTCNLVEIGHQEENCLCTSTFQCTICGKTETSSFQLSKEVLSISTLPQELTQTMTVVIVSYENGQMTGIQMVERPAGDISITVQGSELSSFFLDLNTLTPVMEHISQAFH